MKIGLPFPEGRSQVRLGFPEFPFHLVREIALIGDGGILKNRRVEAMDQVITRANDEYGGHDQLAKGLLGLARKRIAQFIIDTLGDGPSLDCARPHLAFAIEVSVLSNGLKKFFLVLVFQAQGAVGGKQAFAGALLAALDQGVETAVGVGQSRVTPYGLQDQDVMGAKEFSGQGGSKTGGERSRTR